MVQKILCATLIWLLFGLSPTPLAAAQQSSSEEMGFQRFPGGPPLTSQRPPEDWSGEPAQNLHNDVVLVEVETLDEKCETSLDCSHALGSMNYYVPTPETPVKTISVSFNIMQQTDGTGNWTSSPDDLEALRQLAQWVNNYIEMYGCYPSDPCPGVAYTSDSKLRLSLEAIYFFQDDQLWNSNNVENLLAAAFKAHPPPPHHLNVFFTAGSYLDASAFAVTPGADRNYDQAIVMLNAKDSNGTGSNLKFASAGTLAHELSHAFGLLHTYAGGCCPDISDAKSCDYLTDVFCPPTNPYPQMTGWKCDPTLPSTQNSCTNNMMGGVQDACLFSPLQLGRSHRALSTTSAQKYVKHEECLAPPGGMTLWLAFDESTGNAAYNTLGQPGSVVDAVRSAGKVRGGLCFDGQSQYVEVPHHSGLNFSSRFLSLEAWVRRDPGDDGVRVIAEKRLRSSAGYFGYSFFLYNGHPGVQIAAGGYDNYVSPVSVPADGAWHHLALTVDRLRAEGGGLMYLDGMPIWKFSPRRRGSLDNEVPFRVGASSLSPVQGLFKGCIDELAVYQGVLAPSEVKALFEADSRGRCQRYCEAQTGVFDTGEQVSQIEVRVCNNTLLPQAFLYWFEGVPAARCFTTSGAVVGGPTAFTQCSNIITAPLVSCVSVETSVARPGELKPFQTGCYDLAVQALGHNQVTSFQCRGSVSGRGGGDSPF